MAWGFYAHKVAERMVSKRDAFVVGLGLATIVPLVVGLLIGYLTIK